MGDVVNLNRARKARAKAEAAATAAANRVKHGRTGVGKANDRRTDERRQALLDGARRDRPEDDDRPA
ncbi:DUF4169 family protein [Roseicella aquatilis]|uniref:DUF4169 family protein n=1 Tax=Roseicella aquatilis TaxID=2527868 RepID=A0A4R4DTB2_9PROT|nr:DUF4169 family protein [Roseicella aquatilis]TCZ63294.1 DUF4169 family protein [Roseicella aquatilis]